MSDNPRVIQADFANWRPVSGRKVLQLVFEVPIERTEEVMTMLGVPMPGESKWCAIALLDKFALAPKERKEVAKAAEKEHHNFKDLKLSNQAGIRCADQQFCDFIALKISVGTQMAIITPEACPYQIRHMCGVSSRSELDSNDLAAARWRKLEEDYQAYLNDLRYAGSIK